jgi:hypothetical protein
MLFRVHLEIGIHIRRAILVWQGYFIIIIIYYYYLFICIYFLLANEKFTAVEDIFGAGPIPISSSIESITHI